MPRKKPNFWEFANSLWCSAHSRAPLNQIIIDCTQSSSLRATGTSAPALTSQRSRGKDFGTHAGAQTSALTLRHSRWCNDSVRNKLLYEDWNAVHSVLTLVHIKGQEFPNYRFPRP